MISKSLGREHDGMSGSLLDVAIIASDPVLLNNLGSRLSVRLDREI